MCNGLRKGPQFYYVALLPAGWDHTHVSKNIAQTLWGLQGEVMPYLGLSEKWWADSEPNSGALNTNLRTFESEQRIQRPTKTEVSETKWGIYLQSFQTRYLSYLDFRHDAFNKSSKPTMMSCLTSYSISSNESWDLGCAIKPRILISLVLLEIFSLLCENTEPPPTFSLFSENPGPRYLTPCSLSELQN